MKRLLLTTVLTAAIGLAALPAIAATPLPDAAKSALDAALADEYRAEAFYAAVVARFGAVRPFANIIRAEQMHASELRRVMADHGLDPAPNPLLGDATIAAMVPATLAEACRMGVDAETANRDLYAGKLLPAVTGYADIEAVFDALRSASANNHLPAFQRCAARGG